MSDLSLSHKMLLLSSVVYLLYMVTTSLDQQHFIFSSSLSLTFCRKGSVFYPANLSQYQRLRMANLKLLDLLFLFFILMWAAQIAQGHTHMFPLRFIPNVNVCVCRIINMCYLHLPCCLRHLHIALLKLRVFFYLCIE